MRTNIELDDKLVKQTFTLTKLKTKQELVKSHSPKNLLDLAGQIEFSEGFDPIEYLSFLS